MAKGKKIKPTYKYDEESDILYASFGDDEPTFVENLDDNDMVLLEIGWFSRLPKGLRNRKEIISAKLNLWRYTECAR